MFQCLFAYILTCRFTSRYTGTISTISILDQQQNETFECTVKTTANQNTTFKTINEGKAVKILSFYCLNIF